MSTNLPLFRKGVVRPIACLQEGWLLIKDQYWLFFGISAVGLLIGSAVPLGIILGPMMCGIYLCLFRRMRNETVTFDMLFKGFDFFADSLIATLLHMIPIFLIIIPVDLAFVFGMMSVMPGPHSRGGEQPDPFLLFGLMGLLFGVVLLIVLVSSTLFFFVYPLIVDRRLSGINAVKTSIKAAVGNLGGVVGLLLMNVALGFVGVLMCYVGAFLVLPISVAAIAVAYRQVFPAETEPTL